MMRTKKRQTNLHIMQSELEKLHLQAEKKDEKPEPVVGRGVVPVTKVKAARGPPKMPLINTSKLLTG